eukprot:8033416-Pyramimonas_sp.AAC.2
MGNSAGQPAFGHAWKVFAAHASSQPQRTTQVQTRQKNDVRSSARQISLVDKNDEGVHADS